MSEFDALRILHCSLRLLHLALCRCRRATAPLSFWLSYWLFYKASEWVYAAGVAVFNRAMSLPAPGRETASE